MRILIFHGYLLEGTGSNVYNARLAQALADLGHEVHLLCQDRHPERQPFVDAVGDWEQGAMRVRPLREPDRMPPQRAEDGASDGDDTAVDGRVGGARDRAGSCTVYRPDIGGLLPVYVEDRYEGIEARAFASCSEEEIARYLEANVAAVRELAGRVRPEIALANHLIMGPAILARALAGSGTPYAVKVHGSALEYTVKPHPERFLGYAREGLQPAAAVLVGSLHTALSLWKTIGDPALANRTRLGPPGVDVHRFRPRGEAREAPAAPPGAGLRALAGGLRAVASVGASDPIVGRAVAGEESASAFARDELAAAGALERLAGALDAPPEERGPLVAFVGKLIVSKGVDLLVACWPLVLERVPEATLAVVGFGTYRDSLECLLTALAAGDVERALELARAGRAAEVAAPLVGRSPESAPLRHLLAFLEGLGGERRERYLAAARALPERVVLTGRLDHEELAELLPACEALVVPSTFPEAFGMVAAEGAACGALPISAAHSGLAEVSRVLAGAVPAEAAGWLSFPVDDRAVTALAERLIGWLRADPSLRERTRAGLVSAVREHWSWEGVAQGVIAAAKGELDALPEPEDAARSVG